MPISIPLMQRRGSGKDLAGDSGGRGDLFVPPHMLSRQVRIWGGRRGLFAGWISLGVVHL